MVAVILPSATVRAAGLSTVARPEPPEGGFVHGKALGRFHPGMAFLAILTGTPILPVAIIGAEPLPVKKGPLAVVIGKPIPVRKARPDDRNTAALDELVKQRIQAMIEDYGRKKG